MKILLTLITFLTMSQAFALGFTPIEDVDVSLHEVSAKIISVTPLCPPRLGGIRCRAYGSSVRIEVTFSGCLDRLGGYSTAFAQAEGKGILYFSGINLNNAGSETVQCAKAPTKILEVPVPFEGEVELVNLTFVGNHLPQYK